MVGPYLIHLILFRQTIVHFYAIVHYNTTKMQVITKLHDANININCCEHRTLQRARQDYHDMPTTNII